MILFNKMTKKTSALTTLKYMFALSIAILSVSPAFAASVEETISEKLFKSNNTIEIQSIAKTPWEGMYEVTLKSGEVLFSDSNAEYLLVGQMLKLTPNEGIVNLSEQKFQLTVAKTLAEIPDQQQIIYAAQGVEKAVVTVFTDISCYYCKKLHKAIPALQKNGVTVRYMAFPRAGIGSDVEQQMNSIWCSDNPAKAMDIAKNNGEVKPASCKSPVASQFMLGQKIGVNATPTLFTAKGRKMSGFASTEKLLEDLKLTN